MIYSKGILKKIGVLIFVSLEIYFLLRVEFFLWNRSQFLEAHSGDIFWALIHGFRFDISAIFVLTSPIIILSIIPFSSKYEKKIDRFLVFYFILIHLPFILMNAIDIELVNFVGRRSTLDGLFLFKEAQGKWSSVFSVYWPLTLVTFLQSCFFPWLVHWSLETFGQSTGAQPWSYKKFGMSILNYLIAIICSVVAIRGGVQRKPINMSNAQLFNRPILNSFVLNTSFAFIKSYGVQKIKDVEFFSHEKELISLLNGKSLEDRSLLDGKRPLKKQNVFIIILESFALEYMGEINGQGHFTPFLDSLAKKSLFFYKWFC